MRENKCGDLLDRLRSLAERDYRDFMAPLLPSVPKERILGVRMPLLRRVANEIKRAGKADEFIASLPHGYYEENAIHAFLIMGLEYDRCITEVKQFLPYVDNWGICDSLRPACFSENKAALLPEILDLISSDHTYTVRFGIEMLMLHFLGAEFTPDMPERLLAIREGDYYVDMMIAWYFATALSVRYEDILPYLEKKRLCDWVHNKTISKATESLRISADKKKYLKTLRVKSSK